MNDRRGKFFIDIRQIEHNPMDVMEIMKHCVIVRAEMSHLQRGVMYEALSPQFSAVPRGYETPTYTWEKRKGEWWAKSQ